MQQQHSSLPSAADEKWVANAKKIRREIAEQPEKRWNIVTLTRLPIPLRLSAFFEGIEHRFPDMAGRYERGELGLEEVTDYFIHTFRDETALRWFQRQIQEPFGLDVYATPFDKARGYQIYEHGNIRVLLLRLENLNAVGPQAMREFLGIPNFRILNRNVGEAKKTGAVYRDFIRALRLPTAFVEGWHSSRYARHFYTPQELEGSVARWI